MSFKPFRARRRGEISVTFMSGPLDGKKLSFDQPAIGDQRILTIGRRESCDIYMPFDNQVSRLHARLGCASEPVTDSSDYIASSYVLNFWLEDGGSRNGTFIEKNAQAIEGRSPIRPGMLFKIGRTWLRLDIPYHLTES